MKRTRLSPIDIVGISLGVIVILLLAGSIVFIAQNRMHTLRWSMPQMRGWWNDAEIGFGAREREESDQQVEGSFTEVEIRNVAGSIEVIGGGAGPVQVHSVKTAPTREALDGLRVDVEKLGSRLVITEKRDAPPAGWRGSIDFSVTVPKTVTVVRAHSVSGGVTVRRVDTTVDQWLDTISGSISSEGSRDLRASSTSGSIAFAFAGQVLDVHTVSGSIRGSVDSIAKGGSVSLRSVSGPVIVDAFAGLDASVNLRSVSGPVSCAFPLTVSEQRHNRLQGKIGQGSVPVEIRTTSGPISINKL
jgi:hypothetical protein